MVLFSDMYLRVKFNLRQQTRLSGRIISNIICILSSVYEKERRCLPLSGAERLGSLRGKVVSPI